MSDAQDSLSPDNSTKQKREPKTSLRSRWLRRRMFFSAILFAAILTLIWTVVVQMRGIIRQPVNAWVDDVFTDCAVVLTGGPNRLREGFDLLSRKAVQKLIISGVNPQVELKDIFPLKPFYGQINEQDVILERRSRTTYGNAQQTWPLVEALRCKSVMLITSRIHMYRALRTFRAEFPRDFPILPRAVVGNNEPPSKFETFSEAYKSLFYGFWAY